MTARLLSLLLFALALLLVGCPTGRVDDDDDETAPEDDDDAVDDDDGADDDDAVDDDDSGPELPPYPGPLSITFGGAIGETIVFDEPSCTHLSETEFGAFWRGASDGQGGHEHNAVLMVQMLGGGYLGPDTYEVNGMAVRLKLQSEAGAPYDFFYQVTPADGDTGSVTVDYVGDVAWGEFTFSGMTSPSDGATIDATPQPIPIWCDTVQD